MLSFVLEGIHCTGRQIVPIFTECLLYNIKVYTFPLTQIYSLLSFVSPNIFKLDENEEFVSHFEEIVAGMCHTHHLLSNVYFVVESFLSVGYEMSTMLFEKSALFIITFM